MFALEPDDTGVHPLLRYLKLGINVLPLAVGQKSPYLSLVEHWKPLQRQRVTEADVARWIADGDEHMGVGLICGKISDLVCLDADDPPDFVLWILERPDHPLFAGLWIVQTGSGKVHIWVRTLNPPQVHAWKLRADGVRCGEVRGEGSYAAAPPSIHPSGGRYRTLAGSPESMRYVDDVDALARQITEAYLADNPGAVPTPPADRSPRVLSLDKEQQAEAASRVRQAHFSRKITDALLRPGCAEPGQGNWIGCPTHSEVDYALVMAMLRKGWDKDEAEWVFAGTLAAQGCYAKGDRTGSRGRAYWNLTWTKAEAALGRERAASLVATGGNFKVLKVTRIGRVQPSYQIDMEFTRPDGSTNPGSVVMTGVEMTKETSWIERCVEACEEIPTFLPQQIGRDFRRFVSAVLRMTSDTEESSSYATDRGYRENLVLGLLRTLPDHPPQSRVEFTLGWVADGVYYLNPPAIINMLRNAEHGFRPNDLTQTLRSVGTQRVMYWPFADGETAEVIRLEPLARRGVLDSGASPRDADDDGS